MTLRVRRSDGSIGESRITIRVLDAGGELDPQSICWNTRAGKGTGSFVTANLIGTPSPGVTIAMTTYIPIGVWVPNEIYVRQGEAAFRNGTVTVPGLWWGENRNYPLALRVRYSMRDYVGVLDDSDALLFPKRERGSFFVSRPPSEACL